MSEKEDRLAVLIDADNTPYSEIGLVIDYCQIYGITMIKRAYGDWSSSKLKNWGRVFNEYAIKPVQQFSYTKGKNSTDIAMVIEAMDMLHSNRTDTFILVTSDSDFTGLAVRIREEGLSVIGIGRKTAPQSFIKGCNEFVYIENIVNLPTEVTKPSKPDKTKVDTQSSSRDGEELLIKAVRNTSDENGIVLGGSLGAMLRKLDPSFTPTNYGCKRLKDFLALYPTVIRATNEKSGEDWKYEVVELR